jgi:hypothetical protein
MLARSTILAKTARCSRRCAAKASAGRESTSTPMAANLSRVSAAAIALSISAASRSTIGRGVPAGVMIPSQAPTSKPGKSAASAIGGMPGASALPRASEIPNAFTLSERTSGLVAASVSMV